MVASPVAAIVLALLTLTGISTTRTARLQAQTDSTLALLNAKVTAANLASASPGIIPSVTTRSATKVGSY